MKEKGAMRGFLATVAVAALLSAALGGAYSLSERSWNGGWSFETLENNINLVAETVPLGWGGGAQDNRSTDNLPIDNSPTDNTSDLEFWDTHSLDAVPVVRENASVEDLPTVEEVENILFEWDVFENGRSELWLDWVGSYEEILGIIKKYGFEYHFDKKGGLHVDTPGIVYENLEKRDDGQYYISNQPDPNHGYIRIRNALDFSRHLKALDVASGIAGFSLTDAYFQAKTVVPVKEGLAYFDCPGPRESGTINVKPGETYPWWEHGNTKIKGINLHWRLGEGDYVQWNYVLENGEPTMVWPENGQPVDWKL